MKAEKELINVVQSVPIILMVRILYGNMQFTAKVNKPSEVFTRCYVTATNFNA